MLADGSARAGDAAQLLAVRDQVHCHDRLRGEGEAQDGDRTAWAPDHQAGAAVHEGGRPGEINPEIGVACSRACLAKARRILLARRA